MSSSITPSIKIGARTIGAGEPVYVIAEVSANHHQDFEQAVNIIRAAKDAGADAIKLQTYTARHDDDCLQTGPSSALKERSGTGATCTNFTARPTRRGSGIRG